MANMRRPLHYWVFKKASTIFKKLKKMNHARQSKIAMDPDQQAPPDQNYKYPVLILINSLCTL